MAVPTTYTRLKDFTEKLNPVASDIIYMGNSEDNENEVQVTYDNFSSNFNMLQLSQYLTLSPNTYVLGTASQAATTVTGVGTTFTSVPPYSLIVFNTGEYAVITSIQSNTSITVDRSQTVASGSFVIYYGGAQLDSNGNGSFNNIKAAINYPNEAKSVNFSTSATGTFYPINANSSSITVNLIGANQMNGKLYIFKKTDASINTVVINAQGADLIDGSSMLTLTTQYETAQIVSDGLTSWHIIN